MIKNKLAIILTAKEYNNILKKSLEAIYKQKVLPQQLIIVFTAVIQLLFLNENESLLSYSGMILIIIGAIIVPIADILSGKSEYNKIASDSIDISTIQATPTSDIIEFEAV